MHHIYTIGETTFDIIFKNMKPIDAKVGGSMLNTSVSLARLNVPVSFISSFGSDQVGDFSMNFLIENGIDTTYVSRYSENSRIALAFLDEMNNASYSFYAPINKEDVKYPTIEKDDILLFGSSHANRNNHREPLFNFLKEAKNNGAILIYDPNFRKSHLPELPSIKKNIEENIALANIVKGSDEDFQLLFGFESAKEAYTIIKQYGTADLIYTANKNGVWYFTSNHESFYKVPKIEPISTIGAGDNFNAGIIYSLIKYKITSENISLMNKSIRDEMINTSIEFAQEVCMSYENYIRK
jgi:fructokinase